MNYSQCNVLFLIYKAHTENFFTEPTAAFLAILLSAITACTLCANVTVIIALTFYDVNSAAETARSNSTIPKLLMISLATWDLMCGCLVMPLGVIEVIENGIWVFGYGLCMARDFMNYTWVCSSLLHVNFMSLDRFLAICRPLRYRLLTNRTGYIMAAVSWIFPVVLNLVLLFVNHAYSDPHSTKYYCTGKECSQVISRGYLLFSLVLIYCVPFICTYVPYFLIMRKVQQLKNKRNILTAKKHQQCVSHNVKYPDKEKRLRENGIKRSPKIIRNAIDHCHHLAIISVGHLSEKVNTNVADPDFSREIKITLPFEEIPGYATSSSLQILNYNNRLPVSILRGSIPKGSHMPGSRNLKAYKTVGSLVICFTVCWCPSLSFAMVFFQLIDSLPPWLVVSVMWIAYLNAAINPLLYCCNSSVRQAVKNFLRNAKKVKT